MELEISWQVGGIKSQLTIDLNLLFIKPITSLLWCTLRDNITLQVLWHLNGNYLKIRAKDCEMRPKGK